MPCGHMRQVFSMFPCFNADLRIIEEEVVSLLDRASINFMHSALMHRKLICIPFLLAYKSIYCLIRTNYFTKNPKKYFKEFFESQI